jgi:hypothetical protein
VARLAAISRPDVIFCALTDVPCDVPWRSARVQCPTALDVLDRHPLVAQVLERQTNLVLVVYCTERLDDLSYRQRFAAGVHLLERSEHVFRCTRHGAQGTPTLGRQRRANIIAAKS